MERLIDKTQTSSTSSVVLLKESVVPQAGIHAAQGAEGAAQRLLAC